jgi:hypothetical protein
MRKAVLAVIIFLLCTRFLGADNGNLSIQAVRQKLHHCGPACAETILRAYGIHDSWVEQTALAAALCARLPEYKSRHPEARDALERYYPDFVETYQPELAEILIDHGFCVISTRRSIESATGKPMESINQRDLNRYAIYVLPKMPQFYRPARLKEYSEDNDAGRQDCNGRDYPQTQIGSQVGV